MPFTVYWFLEPPISTLARSSEVAGAEPLVNGTATRSSDEQFEALLDGRADLAVTAMDNVMDWNLRPGGGDFRIIAQIERTTFLSLIARKGIDDITEMKGGTLLVDAPENGFVVAARALLTEAGIKSGSYALKSAGGVRERFEALLAGDGDATILGPPFDGMAIAEGAKVLARVTDRYPAFPGQGLVMRRSAHARLGPAVTLWLAALERARALARANPESAAATLAATGMPAPVAKAMASLVPATLAPDREGIDLLIAQRRQAGLRGGDVTHVDLVDTTFLQAIDATIGA